MAVCSDILLAGLSNLDIPVLGERDFNF